MATLLQLFYNFNAISFHSITIPHAPSLSTSMNFHSFSRQFFNWVQPEKREREINKNDTTAVVARIGRTSMGFATCDVSLCIVCAPKLIASPLHAQSGNRKRCKMSWSLTSLKGRRASVWCFGLVLLQRKEKWCKAIHASVFSCCECELTLHC